MIKQVSMPTIDRDLPIGWLSFEIDKLAETFSLEIVVFHEDGLGRARGVAVVTSAGRTVGLWALDRMQELHGPHIEVIASASDIITFGADVLLDEVVSDLSLDAGTIAGRNTSVVEVARRLCTRD